MIKILPSPKFNALLVSYDVFVFVESKLTDLDEIKLPKGLSCVVKNRQKCKRPSSGIIVIFKRALHKHIKLHSTESQFIFWFQIPKQIISLNSDVLFVTRKFCLIFTRSF